MTNIVCNIGYNWLTPLSLINMYNYSFIVTDNYIAFELDLNNIGIILYKILDDSINLLQA